MRKKLMIFFVIILLFAFSNCVVALADDVTATAEPNANSGASSLDEILGISKSEPSKGDAFISGLKETTDMSKEVKELKPIASKLQKGVSIIVQLLAYIITGLMTVRILIDLTYISLPFVRKFMVGANVGTSNGVGHQPGIGGFGSYGGYGNRGFGYNNSYGGFNSGFGVAGQTGLANHTMQQGNNKNIVSNSAIQAVQLEGTVGADGKNVNAYKVYFKDMLAMLIVTPVLLVLSITGVLANLGFALGQLVSRLIQGLSGMM